MTKKRKETAEQRIDNNMEALLEKFSSWFWDFAMLSYRTVHKNKIYHEAWFEEDKKKKAERYKYALRYYVYKKRYGLDDPRTIEAKKLIPIYPRNKDDK